MRFTFAVLPDGEFYVISNPGEVFGTATTQKKAARKDPIQTKAVTAKKVSVI